MGRAEVTALLQAWKQHLKHCPQCRDARSRETWHYLCDDGYAIWDDKRYAEAKLTEDRQADAQPIPGQGEMF